MTIAIQGSGTQNAHALTFTETVKCVGELDGANKQVIVDSGSLSLKMFDITANKHTNTSGNFKHHPAFALPATTTGKWNLGMSIVPSGPSYTGTATIVTAPGETAVAGGKGTYTAFGDTADMAFKGTGFSFKMSFSTIGSTLNIESFKGKVFGQTLNLSAP